MHELSLAQGILEIIRQSVPPDELYNVRTVNLRIGDMAGVVCESLDFSFRALTAETALANTSLSIERVPFCVRCRNCNHVSESEFGLGICPNCSGTETTVISGTELQVVTIDLDEPISEPP